MRRCNARRVRSPRVALARDWDRHVQIRLSARHDASLSHSRAAAVRVFTDPLGPLLAGPAETVREDRRIGDGSEGGRRARTDDVNGTNVARSSARAGGKDGRCAVGGGQAVGGAGGRVSVVGGGGTRKRAAGKGSRPLGFFPRPLPLFGRKGRVGGWSVVGRSLGGCYFARQIFGSSLRNNMNDMCVQTELT